MLSGIAVLAGVFLTILYIRKKRRQVERENNDGDGESHIAVFN